MIGGRKLLLKQVNKFKELLKLDRAYLVKLQAQRASASNAMLGFLDACEENAEARINYYKLQLRLLKPRTERDGLLSPSDITLAKQQPISMFLKIPTSKKVMCLFHADKTPSMHIYTNNYHCYACNAHGTVIDVVMKLRGCSFTSAVKFLINK